MKNPPDDRLKQSRIRTGQFASPDSYGNVGAFVIKGPYGTKLTVISSTGLGWEHASVSCRSRSPSWEEMCFVKDLFWGNEEVVIQYHPRKSAYVNNHPYCLHLWKPIGIELPEPPPVMVGIRSKK